MDRFETQSDDGKHAEQRGRLRRYLALAAIDTGPLRRNRDFRLLFIGRGVSMLGEMVRSVALPFQIYALTHSSLAVGLLGLVEIVPILVFAFLGGALADAHDRRRMVQVTELAMAIVAGALAGNALLPHPQIWLLFGVAAVMTGLDALQRPSLDAMLPRLVQRDELMAASAISGLRSTVAMVAGPAVGGILLATIGLASTYAVATTTFIGSLVALWLMKAVPPPVDAERPSLRRVAEGLRYARSRQDLLGTYVIDMVAMFFGMPMALFPALAAQYGGAGILGLLYSGPAIGSFLVMATSGWTRHIQRHGMAILIAAGVWGAAIALFGLTHSLALALICLAVAGGADAVSGIFRSTIWNGTIPDALRGRLASIELLSYSSGPTLGNVEAGAVATAWNPQVSVVSGGLLCVVGTILVALALPLFRRYDTRLAAIDTTKR